MTNSPIAPEALSIPEACIIAGIGRTALYAELSKGSIPAKKIGRRTLILRTDLLAWLRGLPPAELTSIPSDKAA